VVTIGETVIVSVFAPVFQVRIPEQPLAVRVVDCPLQTVVAVAVIAGAGGTGFTVKLIVGLAPEEQPSIVHVAE